MNIDKQLHDLLAKVYLDGVAQDPHYKDHIAEIKKLFIEIVGEDEEVCHDDCERGKYRKYRNELRAEIRERINK